MDVSWTDWQFVHAAWTQGSFTAAAEALGVGQATVSRRVAQVEEALGTVLFDRHRTGLVPTEAARALRPHLEALSAAADGAALAVGGLERVAEGVVRVAAPPGLCVDWMPVLARRLRRSHPGVTLDVLADIHPRDLVRREADVALRAMATTQGELLSWRIAALRGGVYAAPELVDSEPDPIPWVGWSPELGDIPLARFLAQLFPHPPALTTNDYLVLRACVQAGLGATILGHAEAAALGLVPVPIPVPDVPPMPLYLVVHPALRRVPRVAVVIAEIEALAAEDHGVPVSPVCDGKSAGT